MDNRSRNYSRDVKSYYNGQSPYLRKSRRFEDDRNPDKPTTSAQHPDDFTTSAMKRIFGEDNYRSFDEHSGSREDHDSSQSYCDYITQLADGFMSWIINQVFTSSDHEDYEDHEYHRGHEYHRWQEHHGGHEYHDRDKSNDLKALSPDNQIEKNNKIKEPIAEQKKVAFSDPETGKNEEQRPKSKDRSLHTQKLSDTTGQKTAKQKSVTLAFLEKWKNEEQRPKSKVFNDRSLHTQKLSDTTKQQIAEQKAVTSSYLEKWKNEEQRPKSPEFNELYHLAHDIIKEENTERLLNEKYTKEELIRVIENINRKLQGFAHTQIRNHLKALFSNNVTEKSIAEQKVVTRSYLEKWKD
jgi:transcriptional regulator with XRE-family HTH domain